MTKVVVHFSVNFILETISLLFILLAFVFLDESGVLFFWNTPIINLVLINNFSMTELLKIKECSSIPLSYLLNSVHFSHWLQILSVPGGLQQAFYSSGCCQVVFWGGRLEWLFICNVCNKVLAAQKFVSDFVGRWLVTDSAVTSYSKPCCK